MPSGVLRKPQPGTSQLGGLIRVFVFEDEQFNPDTIFPMRTDIVNGEVAALPLLTTPAQKAARIFFDVKEAEFTSAGASSTTSFNFMHGLTGKVAGYTKEKSVTVDQYMGKDLILVAQLPNGQRILLGQTGAKGLRMKISDKSGKEGNDYIGSEIEFMQNDVVDFRPPFLAADLTITLHDVMPYTN